MKKPAKAKRKAVRWSDCVHSEHINCDVLMKDGSVCGKVYDTKLLARIVRLLNADERKKETSK